MVVWLVQLFGWFSLTENLAYVGHFWLFGHLMTYAQIFVPTKAGSILEAVFQIVYSSPL